MVGDWAMMEKESAQAQGSGVNGSHSALIRSHDVGKAGLAASKPGQETAEILPDIEHWVSGYIPLSKLLRRLVQETFSTLEMMVTELAEVTLPTPMMNGAGHHADDQASDAPTINDTSHANVQKKTRLFEFANSRRAQFIKLLVLARWARQMESISKVIDLRVWLSQKQEDYNSAVSWMGELKRKLLSVGEPRPNIETALQVLAGDQLNKRSDFDADYLPSESLSSQDILAGLRRINTLLSIRLNLHEALPPPFRDFDVASGRATFRVAGEFEVDVSLAEEDPSSQLYFVDMRWNFRPLSSVIVSGRTRDDLEVRANEILRTEGLFGLHDFLHNFTLTHKLGIYRSQALTLSKGHWHHHLLVENPRRILVVRYWCDRPGPKNWIEIGIERGRSTSKAHSVTEYATSKLVLRCFREGREVQDTKSDLQDQDISTANILKSVIARHMAELWTETRRSLARGSLYAFGTLRLQTSTPPTDPLEVCLYMQMTKTKAAKILMERTSGRFAVLPASGINGRFERRLNCLTQLFKGTRPLLSQLRCHVALEEIEASAACMGLESLANVEIRPHSISRLLPKDILAIKAFRRSTWESHWLLLLTCGVDGDQWWIAEPQNLDSDNGESTLSSSDIALQCAFRIPFDDSYPSVADPSLESLALVERFALGMISQYMNSEALNLEGLSHRVHFVPPPLKPNSALTMSIYMRIPSGAPRSASQDAIDAHFSERSEAVKLDYRGLTRSLAATIHIACLRMSGRLSRSIAQGVVNAIPGTVFNSTTGILAFELRTKIGQSCISSLRSRISEIERFQEFGVIITSSKLAISASSRDTIDFAYHNAPRPLRATIHFPADREPYLSFTPPNPHLRIVDFLSTCLQQQGLQLTLALLRITLMPLLTFVKLERRHGSRRISIFALSATSYRIRYDEPSDRSPDGDAAISFRAGTPVYGFDICLRQRRGMPHWFIGEGSLQHPDLRPASKITDDTLTSGSGLQARYEALANGKGQDWRGMGGGFVAGLHGVVELIQKLDTLFIHPSTAEDGPAPHTAVEQVTASPGISRPAKRKAADAE